MKTINQTIETAIHTEIADLLKPLKAPASVWDCYFCPLEDLQRAYPFADRWKLRTSLAAEILERNLTKGKELEKIKAIYRHAMKSLRDENRASMVYTSGEIEGITNY